MKIYVASRASIPARGEMWRRLRSEGANIISTWIDEDKDGQSLDLTELWDRIMEEIRDCDRLVLYVEAADFPLKGAFVEIGAAMALEKPIWVICRDVKLDEKGRPLGSWTWSRLVTCFWTRHEDMLRKAVGL